MESLGVFIGSVPSRPVPFRPVYGMLMLFISFHSAAFHSLVRLIERNADVYSNMLCVFAANKTPFFYFRANLLRYR